MTRTILVTLAIVGCSAIAWAGTETRPTRIEINTFIDVPHAVDDVWEVLADLDGYAEWNPYHVRVEGVPRRGAKLEVEVHKPNGNRLVIHPRVMVASPGVSLVWGGGIPGVFRGVHRFDLEPLSPTCTRLYHTEVFAGLFIGFAELGSIEEGYRAMNEALAERLRHRAGGKVGSC